nr:ABC transporter ATP-binding protein [Sedimentibacter sp.]
MKKYNVKNSVINTGKNNKGFIALLLVLVGAATVSSIVPPLIMKQLIDYNFTLKTDDKLIFTAVIYILVIFASGALNFLKEAVLTVLGQNITKDIRLLMVEKLERISASYYSKNESGQTASRLINDVDAVSSMFTSGIAGMAIDLFKIIGVLISVFYLSRGLGIITIVLLPAIYFLTRFFQKRMLGAQVENRKQVGEVNNHIAESFKNIFMIKSFSKEDYMEDKYVSILENNYDTLEKVNFYDSIFSPIIRIIRAAVIAFIAVMSSKELHYLGISVGMAAASIDLISSLFSPVENLGMELQSIQKSLSGVKRVDEFLREEEDIKEDINEYELDLTSIDIRFNNVSFAYEKGKEVLKNINIQVNPCEKVTFTGRTGVGKSTLFKLVVGLLKPTEGNITINGTDVFQIPNKDKRKIFGYVEQNFHMIKGTVADQVSLGDKDIHTDNIKHALRMVGLLEYVEGFENGCDTFVKNDNIFSQGQKQLLSIARALVNNPPILILDEITANLDQVTEEKIVSVLEKAGENRTILTISHRLSSMAAADKIVILENGRVKNYGTPEMLLKNDEWYKNHIKLENLTWT